MKRQPQACPIECTPLQAYTFFEFSRGGEHAGKEGDGPRKYLWLNSRPKVAFADLCKRGETGLCSFNGRLMATPSVHIYTAGWVCKDDSPANRVSRKPLGLHVDCLSGESTKTLHSSIDYIRRFRPCAVILENTLRPRNIQIVQQLFSQIAGYYCIPHMLVTPTNLHRRHRHNSCDHQCAYVLMEDSVAAHVCTDASGVFA